jgi:guanosine-3',5'-bis(diphosphate) 3'-pyrophosphohydrolase
LSRLQLARNFASERHSVNAGREKISAHLEYLTGVVSRLKNLGVTDEDVLAAAWLLDVMDETNTCFDELDKKFGSKVAVLILSISRDRELPRARQEAQFIKQLRESSIEAKLITLCNISANLRGLQQRQISGKRKIKEVKKKMYYLNIIKSELVKNKLHFLGIENLFNSINEIASPYGLSPISYNRY